MLNDEIYQVTLGKGNFKGSDDTPGIEIRLDFDIPIRDYSKIDPALGAQLAAIATHGLDTFRQTQHQIEFPPCELSFAPKKNDLSKQNGKHCTSLGEVQFNKRVIVVKRVNKDVADEDDPEPSLYLLLTAKLSKSERHTMFVRNYFQMPAWCRIQVNQGALFDNDEIPNNSNEELEPCPIEET